MRTSTPYYILAAICLAAALLTPDAQAQGLRSYDPCACVPPPPPCPCDYNTMPPTGAGQQAAFHSVVYFETDKVTLTEDAKVTLDLAAKALKMMADTVIIRAEGHTDVRGNNDYNEVLSLRRAIRVRDHLVSRGVSLNRIGVIGFGERMPVSTEHRLNRRVEIVTQ